MAIDNRDERHAVLNFGVPFPVILPDPDGTIAEIDRKILLNLLPGSAAAEGGGPGTGKGIPQDVWVVPAALEVDRLVEVESLEAIKNELDDLHKEHRKVERKVAKADTPALRRETNALSDYIVDKITWLTEQKVIVGAKLRQKKLVRNRKLKQQAIAAETTRQEDIARQRLTSLRKARERKRALDAVKKTSLKH